MRRCIASVLIAASLFAACGCASILEGETLTESKHSGIQHERQPDGQLEASTYDELKAVMLGLVEHRTESGRIIIHSYDGDVQSDVLRACGEIKDSDPLGAYAVSEITAAASKIVTYFEVEVNLEFKRTKRQMDSIITVSTLRYLRSELLSFMSDYYDESVIRTSLSGINAEDVAGFVKELYYQNPRDIIMLPVTAVEIFPESGVDKIIELRFGNISPANISRVYGMSLTNAVRHNAEAASGVNDGEILLSLAENMIASAVFDEGTAKTLVEHGSQNYAATAYGALVNGSAVGEGFAMAYKALCDELGFDCRVVLGYLDGMVHAWNIVMLHGDYYHIDVSMCAAAGVESAFLKSDEDISESYSWNMENTVKCTGALTYDDIVSSDDVQ